MRAKSVVYSAVVVGVMGWAQMASATEVRVTITNEAPAGGIRLTPVWVGFHNGSFDSYDAGEATSTELETIAELGNADPLSQTFLANGTLAPSTPAVATQVGVRVDGSIANGAPLAPGESASEVFNIDATGANRFLSYVSMILPSSDYYIANGNPQAIDLLSLHNAPVGTAIPAFMVAGANDAGTELNDFETSAGNGLFFSDPAGTATLSEDNDTVTDNTNVTAPFANFLNPPSNFDFGPLDFTQYTNGIASIQVEVVPEPASLMALGLGAMGLALRRPRRRA